MIRLDCAHAFDRAHEAHGAQVRDHELVRDLPTTWKWERDLDACAFGQLQDAVDGLADGVGTDLPVALGAMRPPYARPEQTEVIVDFSRGADGGAARLGRVLLLDRDGWRDAFHRIHIRLLHTLEKLLGVCGKRLHVPALTLGEKRVERERALAGPRWTGDDRELPPGQIQVDALEVVLASSANADGVVHAERYNRRPHPTGLDAHPGRQQLFRTMKNMIHVTHHHQHAAQAGCGGLVRT